MGTIDRWFNVFRGANQQRGQGSPATLVDRERGQHMQGLPFTQTAEELAGTRQRMEDELDTQREQRAAAKGLP